MEKIRKAFLLLLCIGVLFIISLQFFIKDGWNSSESRCAGNHREGQKNVQDSVCTEGNSDTCYNNREALTLTELRTTPKCQEVFYEGSFITPTLWAPTMCTNKNYTWSDLQCCLLPTNSSHAFAMIGDSRMRQITHMLKNYLFNTTIRTLFSQTHEYETYTQPLLNLKIEFFWDPYADATMRNHFSSWLQAGNSNKAVTMVVVGVGVWHQLPELGQGKEAGIRSLAAYEADLRMLYPLLKDLAQRIPVVFAAAGLLDYFRREGKTPYNHITVYNDLAERTLNGTGVIFWKSAYWMANLTFNGSPDFNHYTEATTIALVNTLLNFYCNSKWMVSPDRCCSSKSESTSNSPTTVTSTAAEQSLTIYLYLLGLSIALFSIVQ